MGHQHRRLAGAALRLAFVLAGGFATAPSAMAQSCPLVGAGTWELGFVGGLTSPTNGQVFTAPYGGKATIPISGPWEFYNSAYLLSSLALRDCAIQRWNVKAGVMVNGSAAGGWGSWSVSTWTLGGAITLAPGTYSLAPYGSIANSLFDPSIYMTGAAVNITVVQAPPPPPAPGPVIGFIDGVATNGSAKKVLLGWACDKRAFQSIDIRLYVDGPAGTGALLTTATTNKTREAAVSNECITSGVAHGFEIDLSPFQQQYAGRSIYAHGVSTSGGTNVALTNSGQFAVPAPSTGPVWAYVDGLVNTADGKSYLQGWACDRNVPQSIDVHVYFGGAAGVGTFGLVGRADTPREAAVGQGCGTSGVPHGFYLDLTPYRTQFGGRSIYVHGISTQGGTNSIATHSGEYFLPY